MNEEKKLTYAQRATVAEAQVEVLRIENARQATSIALWEARVTETEERLDAINAELVKSQENLKRTNSNYEYASKARTEAEAMIEQLHQLLDSLPNAVDRVYKAPNSTYEQTFTLPMRFTAAVVRGCFRGAGA